MSSLLENNKNKKEVAKDWLHNKKVGKQAKNARVDVRDLHILILPNLRTY